jgi:outer membrane receptor for ferrienterochelin and colicin
MKFYVNFILGDMFYLNRILNTKFLKLFLLAFIFLSFYNLQAQSSSISGTIVDKQNGEALIGANVLIKGTSIGSATDLEGKFEIKNVAPGIYTLVASMVGYAKLTVTDVEVKSGSIVKLNISLSSKAIETEEVVITAKKVENSEASLLKLRQKSTSISDAISAEFISRSGSSNAADAMTKVTGASVVDGKYIYVRGLGDRYTSSELNGAEIPSIDPYRRGGSIDIIPSNLIDNIQAEKSFTPDKPGDFAGGSVDISTKDFPEKFTLDFSASSEFNSALSFSSNGLGTPSSSTDWLGYDNGMRSIPDILNGTFWQADVGHAQRDDQLAKEITDVTRSFSNEMVPTSKTIPINQSYALSIGDQINLFGNPFGYIASLTYKNNNNGYIDGEFNRWSRGVADPNKTQLDVVLDLQDTQVSNSVLVGGVFKGSYKFHQNHIISVDGLYNQNGINTARYVHGSFPYDQNPEWIYESRSIQYQQRTLGSIQLDGQHSFPSIFGTKFNWKASHISLKDDEPDLRYFYNYMTPDSVFGIKSNTAPERYFRNTTENQNEYQANLTIPFVQWSGITGNLKFGGRYSEKIRSFRERRFVYNPVNQIGVFFRNEQGNISELFSDKYLGWASTDTLGNGSTLNRIPIYVDETNQISSNYNGDNFIRAVYGMFDLPLYGNLRLISGVRYETTNMTVVSQNPDADNGKINTKDLLPAVGLIFNVIENMNLRFSYGKTLARPNFREIAPFKNYDFRGGDSYVGNPSLERTLIDNYDIRWEWFTRPGEIYSVSLFYKRFNNPIEAKILDGVNKILSWSNVPRADVEGVEVEARKNLNFISPSLSNFVFGGNFSYIWSKVDIDSKELKDIQTYEPNASSTRPFQGQSPYLVNLYLNFDDDNSGWSASIFYNVFGKRLATVGSVGAPDVYEKPFNMLNASVSKKLFQNISLKISAKNILNSKVEKYQEFKGNEFIYSSYRIGSGIAVELKYNL